jgi:hypothetical protein
VVEVALATQTAPADWWDEPDEVLATAIHLLQEQADRMKQRKGRRRGK